MAVLVINELGRKRKLLRIHRRVLRRRFVHPQLHIFRNQPELIVRHLDHLFDIAQAQRFLNLADIVVLFAQT